MGDKPFGVKDYGKELARDPPILKKITLEKFFLAVLSFQLQAGSGTAFEGLRGSIIILSKNTKIQVPKFKIILSLRFLYDCFFSCEFGDCVSLLVILRLSSLRRTDNN